MWLVKVCYMTHRIFESSKHGGNIFWKLGIILPKFWEVYEGNKLPEMVMKIQLQIIVIQHKISFVN